MPKVHRALSFHTPGISREREAAIILLYCYRFYWKNDAATPTKKVRSTPKIFGPKCIECTFGPKQASGVASRLNWRQLSVCQYMPTSTTWRFSQRYKLITSYNDILIIITTVRTFMPQRRNIYPKKYCFQINILILLTCLDDSIIYRDNFQTQNTALSAILSKFTWYMALWKLHDVKQCQTS